MARIPLSCVRAWLTAAAVLAPLGAHDLWLVPPEGPARLHEPLVVVAASGTDFPASEHAVPLERLQGSVVGPDGAAGPLLWELAEEERCTKARFTPGAPGAWLVCAQTQPRLIELTAEEFNEYLLLDGIPGVLADRIRSGEMDRPAKERYSKYVKALVPVGGSSDGAAARWCAGLKLEIVPRRNPLEARPGELLEVQVLFDGQPLPRAVLCWDHPGNGADFCGQTWTDAEGVAAVPVARAGLMTLRLVHMTRPRTDECEWESFWASFTFRVAEP